MASSGGLEPPASESAANMTGEMGMPADAALAEDTSEFELVPCVVIPDENQSQDGYESGRRGSFKGRRTRKKPRPRATRPRKNSGDAAEQDAVAAGPEESAEDAEPTTDGEAAPQNAVDEATAYALILEQLEHYFSVKNLCRDVFMRSYMDTEGWVPLPFVADFNCIRMVSDDLALVRKCAEDSDLLEWCEEHDKLRLKENWERWLFPNPHTGGYGLPLWLKSQAQPEDGDGEEALGPPAAPAADRLPARERRLTASAKPFIPDASAKPFVPGGAAPADEEAAADAGPEAPAEAEVDAGADLINAVETNDSDFFSRMAAAVDATVDRDEAVDGSTNAEE